MSAFILDDMYARTAKRSIVSAYKSSQGWPFRYYTQFVEQW